MKRRFLSAFVLLLIAISCVFLSEISRVLFFAVCGTMCAWELSKNFEKLDARCTLWVLILYMFVSACLTLAKTGLFSKISCFCAAVYLSLFSGIIHKNVSGKGSLYTLAGICYPCMLFVITMEIVISDIWLETLICSCISSWFCDAFALFGGKRFGKHKIAPNVSPNKTLEGCISGAISSILIAIPVYFLFFRFSTLNLNLPICILIFLISSSMGQIGDLAESLLKRMIGIKDFSNLIPGHGGMFDRADSLIFAIPTAYFLIRIFTIN